MLTEDELKAIEERERAATEGPWTVGIEKSGMVLNPATIYAGETGIAQVYGISLHTELSRLDHHDAQGLADAQFSAHSRTDIPALLQHIREQAAELEMLRAFAGGEVLMSDFQTAGEMRAEIKRLRNENAMRAASINFLKLPSGTWEPNDKSKDELQQENTQLRERVSELEEVRRLLDFQNALDKTISQRAGVLQRLAEERIDQTSEKSV